MFVINFSKRDAKQEIEYDLMQFPITETLMLLGVQVQKTTIKGLKPIFLGCNYFKNTSLSYHSLCFLKKVFLP